MKAYPVLMKTNTVLMKANPNLMKANPNLMKIKSYLMRVISDIMRVISNLMRVISDIMKAKSLFKMVATPFDKRIFQLIRGESRRVWRNSQLNVAFPIFAEIEYSFAALGTARIIIMPFFIAAKAHFHTPATGSDRAFFRFEKKKTWLKEGASRIKAPAPPCGKLGIARVEAEISFKINKTACDAKA